MPRNVFKSKDERAWKDLFYKMGNARISYGECHGNCDECMWNNYGEGTRYYEGGCGARQLTKIALDILRNYSSLSARQSRPGQRVWSQPLSNSRIVLDESLDHDYVVVDHD